MPEYVETVMPDGVHLQRKVRFHLSIGGDVYPCVSATHVSRLLQTKAIDVSPWDVYNRVSKKREFKRLADRWPDHVGLERVG